MNNDDDPFHFLGEDSRMGKRNEKTKKGENKIIFYLLITVSLPYISLLKWHEKQVERQKLKIVFEVSPDPK